MSAISSDAFRQAQEQSKGARELAKDAAADAREALRLAGEAQQMGVACVTVLTAGFWGRLVWLFLGARRAVVAREVWARLKAPKHRGGGYSMDGPTAIKRGEILTVEPAPVDDGATVKGEP